MSNCLVTTLKDSVTDTELLKLGEMKFKLFGNSVKTLVVNAGAGTVTFTTKSPGYFTDANGTSNLGTSKTMSNNVNNEAVYLSPGEYEVVISGKYALKLFQSNSQDIEIDFYDFSGDSQLDGISTGVRHLKQVFDIAFLKNFPNFRWFNVNSNGIVKTIVGDIAVFRNLPMVNINLPNNTEVYGDLNTFAGKTSINHIDVYNNKKITGNISSLSALTNMLQLQLGEVSNVEGNINALSGMTKMDYLTVQNTKVTGNLSSLATCTALKILNVSGTSITGDTSDLANLTNLTSFTYTNTAITGTWPLT